jgi:hypothetical protein
LSDFRPNVILSINVSKTRQRNISENSSGGRQVVACGLTDTITPTVTFIIFFVCKSALDKHRRVKYFPVMSIIDVSGQNVVPL